MSLHPLLLTLIMWRVFEATGEVSRNLKVVVWEIAISRLRALIAGNRTM